MTEENTTPNAPEAAETPVEAAAEPKQGIESLPEWAQKELRQARDDAANYRTKFRDAETRLKDAKTPEEFEAARAELAEQNAKLSRTIDLRNAADEAELPAFLIDRVKGETYEEMVADAKALKESLGITAPKQTPRKGPGGGGLDPKDESESLGDLAGTPRERADRMRNAYRIR